jgi:hypothetical protein
MEQVLDTGGVGRSRRDAVKKITNPGPPKAAIPATSSKPLATDGCMPMPPTCVL